MGFITFFLWFFYNMLFFFLNFFFKSVTHCFRSKCWELFWVLFYFFSVPLFWIRADLRGHEMKRN